ncbi:hypothetical protein BRC82_03975 [Halobacteriales archaeon QS_1_67_19]|nr:MAG: hypothetical protein BRC82_03975 [Halobacteriales archaeon QS_1_67_19]
MVDEETANSKSDRRKEMAAEREREVEEELERVDEEMDPRETEQSDAATFPDEEDDGDGDRTDERHVESHGEDDSA